MHRKCITADYKIKQKKLEIHTDHVPSCLRLRNIQNKGCGHSASPSRITIPRQA